MKEKKAVGIVLYNPDVDRFQKCLKAVEKQCDKIYLVDNASDNIPEILKIVEAHHLCQLIRNKKNMGIAAALNQIMLVAESDGFEWVLTLDDDSVCDKDLLQKLWMKTKYANTGIICPIAVDDRISSFKSENNKGEWQEVKKCITAGALTNVYAWRKCGGFDEKMFIDFVDIEYCARLQEYGYRIVQVLDTCVHQQYGNVTRTISIFGKHFSIYNYSTLRIYYSVRNQIYYMRKHKESIDELSQLFFLIGYIGKRIVFEKNRLKSIEAVFKGIRDGKNM